MTWTNTQWVVCKWKKDFRKKPVLPKRQNATHSLGEAIMQRHEEVVNWRLEQACQELEDCELTAVWPMNGKCEWQEQWVQIRYWLSSYWICNLQLVISNTWSTLYTLQRAILAGRGVPSKGKSKTNLTRPYLDSKSLW